MCITVPVSLGAPDEIVLVWCVGTHSEKKHIFQNKCFHGELNLGASRRTFEKKIESHYECTCERTFLIMENPILFVRLYLNVKLTRCVIIIYNLQYRLTNYSRFTMQERDLTKSWRFSDNCHVVNFEFIGWM